eukprot:Clim_evm48s235 gene=Clim_evmTU48s235
MFKRIFGGTTPEHKDPDFSEVQTYKDPPPYNPPDLDLDRIRVMVYRDIPNHDRIVLLDSDYGGPTGPEEPEPEHCKDKNAGTGAQRQNSRWKYGANDAELIGEMVFGTLPLHTKGMAVKIHHLKNPNRIMITRIFSIRQKEAVPQVSRNTSRVQLQTITLAEDEAENTGDSSQRFTVTTNSEQQGGRISPMQGGRISPLATVGAGVSESRESTSRRGLDSILADFKAHADEGQTLKPITKVSQHNSSPSLSSEKPMSETVSSNMSSRAASLKVKDGQRVRKDPGAKMGFHSRRMDRGKQFSIEYGRFRTTVVSSTGKSVEKRTTKTAQPNNPSVAPKQVQAIKGALAKSSLKPPQVGVTQQRPSRHRQVLYGIAIIINFMAKGSADHPHRERPNLILYHLIFSHYTLIDLHLHQFQTAIASALLFGSATGPITSTTQSFDKQLTQGNGVARRRPRIEPFMFQNSVELLRGVADVKQQVVRLYHMERISDPAWLNMVSFRGTVRRTQTLKVMQTLAQLIRMYDGKGQKYFISKILTAVLHFHLGWVPTVAPSSHKAADHLEKRQVDHLEISGKLLPYSPLWAQLCDLYGNVGPQNRLARTLIVGRDANLIRKILHILTYFIRCNEVFEDDFKLDGLERGEFLNLDEEVDSMHSRSEAEDTEQLTLHATAQMAQARAAEKLAAKIAREKTLQTDGSEEVPETSQSNLSLDVDEIDEYMRDIDIAARIRALPEDDTDDSDSQGLEAMNLVDLPLPKTTRVKELPNPNNLSSGPHDSLYSTNTMISRLLGRSLLGGYTDEYVAGMVMMGLPQLDEERLAVDLKHSLKYSLIDEPIDEAVAIVGDADNFNVRVLSTATHIGDQSKKESSNSDLSVLRVDASNFLVKSMQTFLKMVQVGLDPTLCRRFIEDKLRDVYHRSKVLAVYLEGNQEDGAVDAQRITPQSVWKRFGWPESDFSLYLTVASTHSTVALEYFRDVDPHKCVPVPVPGSPRHP